MTAYLESLGLTGFEAGLLNLGVNVPNDLQYIEEADLLPLGMTLVQARKLLANYVENVACSSSETGQQIVPPEPVVAILKKRRTWWNNQCRRPRRLIFIRHGESEANVDRKITETVPDHMLHLTAVGRQQSLDAGVRLRELVGEETVKFAVSPYIRTRETLNGIMHAWGGAKAKVREDVRLREQEYGNYDSPEIRELHKEKQEFGAFYYRFPNGESPADCYDRASMFFESMYRNWLDNEHDNQVVVSHGMMIVVTIMRLFHMKIEHFDSFESLRNCEFVVLERPHNDPEYSISFTWAPGEEKRYGYLRTKPSTVSPALALWDGSPDSPLITRKRDT